MLSHLFSFHFIPFTCLGFMSELADDDTAVDTNLALYHMFENASYGASWSRVLRNCLFTESVAVPWFQLVDVLVLLALLGPSQWVAMGSSHCKLHNEERVRPHSVTITEFGAVGDGVTLNTKAFQNAIFYLNSFADKGGAKLFVPAGRWLTGSFDLISHLTLWLDKGAVILGSTVLINH